MCIAAASRNQARIRVSLPRGRLEILARLAFHSLSHNAEAASYVYLAVRTSAVLWFGSIAIACSAPEIAQPPVPRVPVELSIPSRGATLAATLQFPEAGRPPFPAIVLAHGSGRIAREDVRPMAQRFLSMGLAVLTYDKRGVGKSTGTYVNVGTARSVEIFDLLADDALAGVATLKARKDIASHHIGLGGASQAGWIVPLAASKSKDVSFLVILSGPAVSVGEEIAYSRLAGADPGSIQGLSDTEIDLRMKSYKGPYGFDPVPVLETLATPSLWIEGDHDRSVPMARTLATLERVRAAGRPITIIRLPGLDHSLRNPVTGESPNFWPRVRDWLVQLSVFKSNEP
jgi:alpha-beta hydrolase superfamily lysophospholipase